jgi:class 3 adenylate cyclase
MEQKQLVIILADISGYTQFMVESQTAAVHGQLVINGLIESILKQVDIPLTLQEIEGDAVFLYAAHPGSDSDWKSVVEQVSRKLGMFFESFIAELGIVVEATPCPCAICRNAEKLGLKIVVHAGEAMFHEIAGRPQVSGSDVILAHRLLKNSVAANFYLLLTDAAYVAMGAQLPGTFDRHQEAYDGFGTVTLRVRDLTQDMLAARDSVYGLDESGLKAALRSYKDAARPSEIFAAALQQLRFPIRRFSWREKFLMLFESGVVAPIMFVFYFWLALPKQLRARGQRRVR